MKALVTGGAGFIGSHLVRRLVAVGHEVHVLDSNVPDLSSASASGVRWFQGDIRSLESVAMAAAGCDVIFHQAAIPSVAKSFQDPGSTLSVGIQGTLNVLESARDCGIRRVIAASSSAVYGDSPVSPKTEAMPLCPLSPYAISKQVGEQLGETLGPQFGVEMVSLRYFNVYGPGQAADSDYAAVIPRFLTQVLSGETPTVFGDGEQTRDFIHVNDVVDANLAAAAVELSKSVAVNIGSGYALSLNSLLATIGEVLNRRIDVRYAPARTGDILNSVANADLAHALLGFRSTTTLRESLAGLVEDANPVTSLANG